MNAHPLRVNEGERPSAFALGLSLTGERPPLEGPEAAAFAAEVEEAREALAPFDFELLRAASHRLEDPKPVAAPPQKAPWWRGLWWTPLLACAAAAALVAVQPTEPEGRRSKGAADLDFLVLHEGAENPVPGFDDQLLAAGDAVQFTYFADGLDSLVLLSVDGEGTLSVFYPAAGERPVPVVPGERHVLEGSIVLDDAPGPELFVAVFGPSDVAEARALVMDAYKAGGAAAVQALRDDDPALDVITIQKERR